MIVLYLTIGEYAFENAEVRDFIKLLAVLPLIPLDKIDNAWMENEIHGSAPSISGVEDFMNYMVNTWINDEGSKYERILWNQ